MSSYPYWVISSESKKKGLNQPGFNKALSSTYELKDNHLLKFNYDKYDLAYCSYETMNINSKPIANFYFLLSTNFEDTPITSGAIGLDVQNRIYMNTPGSNFIEQLKKNNIIDSYHFAIKYSADKENKGRGELIIGQYPHEIDDSLSAKDLISIRPLIIGENLFWGINLDRVKSGDAIISNEATAAIKIEIGLFIGPSPYYNYVKTTFFDELIKKEQCRQVQHTHHFQGFVCEKTTDTTKFDDLLFKKGNTVFAFTSKDLFKEELDQKVFMVVFPNRNYHFKNADWTLGEPFLRKYLFVFNQDRKTMEFYRHNDELQIGDDDEHKGWFFIKIFLFVFGMLTSVAILFLVYRAIQRKQMTSKTTTKKEVNCLLSKDDI